jgi:hypothetical protein
VSAPMSRGSIRALRQAVGDWPLFALIGQFDLVTTLGERQLVEVCRLRSWDAASGAGVTPGDATASLIRRRLARGPTVANAQRRPENESTQANWYYRLPTELEQFQCPGGSQINMTMP